MIKWIYKNGSLLFLLFSAVVFFLSNIIAKKTLSISEFYLWNFLTTLVAMSFSFGLLGTEQIFLRFGEVESSKVYLISFNVIKKLFISLLLYLLIIFILFHTKSDVLFYILICLICSSILIIYNYFRILSYFLFAQIVFNGWKVFLLLWLLSYSFLELEVEIFTAVLISLLTSIFLAFIFISKNEFKLRFEKLEKTPVGVKYIFAYTLSLLVITLLGYMDRWLIEYTNKGLFSDYVYLISIILMPFMIIANYLGFKEVSTVKKSLNKEKIVKKIILLSAILVVSYSIWFLFIYKFRNLFELEISVIYYLPLLLIVLLRCSYALLSAIIGIAGNIQDIIIINIVSFLFILILAYCFFYVSNYMIIELLYLMCFLWLIRVLLYFWGLSKIRDYNEI